jgi:hypothetical protein
MIATIAALALTTATALADPPLSAGYQLQDAGHEIDAPVALVVITPGMDPAAFQPMVQALEDHGLDAWAVRVTMVAPLPPADADLWIASSLLPAAVTRLRERNPRAETLALVGHGPGGTLALMMAQHVNPSAVAVLGAPLGPIDTAALTAMAQGELPQVGNVDLSKAADWQDHDLATLLLGDPPPPLAPLAVELARAWLGWIEQGPPLTLAEISCPVWIGAGAMDRLVPIESLRVPSQALPDRHFVRFGLLRLDPQDPGSADLLRERRYLEVMAGWVAGELD